jgi:hypothetical protein
MVYRACRWRRQGACTCGWSGARRFLRGWAVVDALVHAGNSGHEPALRLVVDTTTAQHLALVPSNSQGRRATMPDNTLTRRPLPQHLQHDSAALRLSPPHLRGLDPR